MVSTQKTIVFGLTADLFTLAFTFTNDPSFLYKKCFVYCLLFSKNDLALRDPSSSTA